MAFSRKNKRAAQSTGADSTTESAGGVAVATATKKRKPQELLTSVVKESTAGAAVALLRENERFSLPNGSWLVLGLAVEGIGGLSMKQKNDEAKGSIIELISADEITTVATLDMLAMETFGIIPSAGTLRRMDEFSLLKGADYLWVVMTQTPEGTLSADPVAMATYAQAVEISEGRSSIQQVLPEIWAWANGGAADEPAGSGDGSASADEPLAGDVAGVADHENPFGSDVTADGGDGFDYAALDADQEISAPESDFAAFEEQFSEGAGEEAATDYPDPDSESGMVRNDADDRVIDEAEVRASIARRFLSSDLDLVVDLDTFETNFTHNAPVIAFPLEEDTTDWLGRQINQLARQANTELEQLRTNNLNSLRETWVSLMSQHIEQVIADVSPDREGSYYHRLLNAAKEDLADRRRKGPEEVAALRRELVERYETEAAARGRQAAEQAVTRYKDQNRPRLERDLAEVGQSSERASEEFYDGAQQIILDTRRRDALARMDLGKTKIMDVLIEAQQSHREEEEASVRRWSEEMKQVIDVYRKDDIARSETLAIQQRRDHAVAQLTADQAARVEEMRVDQEERVTRLNREIEKIRTDAVEELAAREKTWEYQLSVEKRNSEHANTRVSNLLSEFEQINKISAERYSHQIKSLEADKASYSLELDRAHKIQSRATKLMVLLVVVVALACTAVGFILGAGSAPTDQSAAAGWFVPGYIPQLL